MAKKPPTDPHDVPYKRWKNLRFGYFVEVLEVKSYPGAKEYRTVTVQRLRTRELRTWSVEVFLRSFQAVGKKMRRRTAWEHLLREDQ